MTTIIEAEQAVHSAQQVADAAAAKLRAAKAEAAWLKRNEKSIKAAAFDVLLARSSGDGIAAAATALAAATEQIRAAKSDTSQVSIPDAKSDGVEVVIPQAESRADDAEGGALDD